MAESKVTVALVTPALECFEFEVEVPAPKAPTEQEGADREKDDYYTFEDEADFATWATKNAVEIETAEERYNEFDVTNAFQYLRNTLEGMRPKDPHKLREVMYHVQRAEQLFNGFVQCRLPSPRNDS